MTRYVLIGTGVAAIAAAEAIRSLDNTGSLTFLTEDPDIYYSRPGLAYYLSGEVHEKLLYSYEPQDYRKLNVKIFHERVIQIHPEGHVVELSNNHRIVYDRLLIATGARAVPLSIPGAHLEGVSKLDHLNDARRIISQSRKARTAVVTGGGITALELAEGLSARHVKVHYVLRGMRYWANVLDEIESQIIQVKLQDEGIILHFTNQLAEIIGHDNKVRSVTLSGGESIACEMVAYAIGTAPHFSLAAGATIRCDRGILVDEFMQTNMPGIFAAGDVAQVYDPMVGKHVLDTLWSPAREQGYTAGCNMAGHTVTYNKPIPFNVTPLAGLTTTIIGQVGSGDDKDLVGIARGDSETWRQTPDAITAQCGFGHNHLRLMVGEKCILGAIVMGDQQFSTALQMLIRNKVDITPIREQLLTPNAPITTIFAEFLVEYYHVIIQAASSST